MPNYYYNSFKDWNDYLEYKKKIQEKKKFALLIKEEEEPVAYFSCIPWTHFESMTNLVYRPYST